MTLGALVALAVLVAAGVYVPRWEKARASGQTSQGIQQAVNPANSAPAAAEDGSQPDSANPSSSAPPTSGSQQPATNAGETKPSNLPSGSASNSALAGAPNAPVGDSGNAQANATETGTSGQRHPSNSPPKGQSSANQAQASEQPSAPAPTGSTQSGQSQGDNQQASNSNQARVADSATVDNLEHEMDQLSSRATAAKDGVENLRRQMSQQGLNLRGDISAAEQRMDTYMGKAQSAFQNQDAKSTKKYLDLAEPEIETLEKFLGRR